MNREYDILYLLFIFWLSWGCTARTDQSLYVKQGVDVLYIKDATIVPTQVPSHIQTLFDSYCLNEGCHSSGEPGGGLILTEDRAYKMLINVPAIGDGTKVRVRPYKPEESYLLLRVTGEVAPQMPVDGSLKEVEIQALTEWIGNGAYPRFQSPEKHPADATLDAEVDMEFDTYVPCRYEFPTWENRLKAIISISCRPCHDAKDKQKLAFIPYFVDDYEATKEKGERIYIRVKTGTMPSLDFPELYSGEQLSEEEISCVRKWIDQGAQKE